MGTLTIRNLDDDVKLKLRMRAAERGVSMEQEAREALARAVATEKPRRKPLMEELRKLAITPKGPFDQKKASDELWDASFE